ncbi:alcohol dehydrogenase catalytic domain-containing protein [Sorangium sp. So ce1182]|uniref:alcohol dehydrogenase catalytic domain-containing protein n=1 Tax=Sorangium sp. So ce1182 TaxID=3133334 RepID=UPI003F647248
MDTELIRNTGDAHLVNGFEQPLLRPAGLDRIHAERGSRVVPARADSVGEAALLPGGVEPEVRQRAASLPSYLKGDLGQGYRVERAYGQVFIARQSGLPQPKRGEVVVKVLAASFCNSDAKVILGDKTPNVLDAGVNKHVIPGHEAVGVVVSAGEGVEGFAAGDLTVIMPHLYPEDHEHTCQAPAGDRGPRCIGHKCSRHLGWDVDGLYSDYACVSASLLVPVPESAYRRTAEALGAIGSDLRAEALFSLTEPAACALTMFPMLCEAGRERRRAEPAGKRALVLGAGPMGCLCALALLDQGYEVSINDVLLRRMDLAVRWSFEGRVRPWTPSSGTNNFDMVVTTAPTATAFKTACEAVRDGGVIYLFAGLVARDREAMDPARVVHLESVHRRAHSVELDVEGKHVLLVGHSGYFEPVFDEAVDLIARHAVTIDRLVTHTVDGWMGGKATSRVPGGQLYDPDDGRPAILHVLHNSEKVEFLESRIKLMVLTDGYLSWAGEQA